MYIKGKYDVETLFLLITWYPYIPFSPFDALRSSLFVTFLPYCEPL